MSELPHLDHTDKEAVRRAAVLRGRAIMAAAAAETLDVVNAQMDAQELHSAAMTGQSVPDEMLIPEHVGTIQKELSAKPVDTTLPAYTAHSLLRDDGTFERPRA